MSSMRYLSKKLEKLKQSYVKTFQTNKVIKGIPQKLREGGECYWLWLQHFIFTFGHKCSAGVRSDKQSSRGHTERSCRELAAVLVHNLGPSSLVLWEFHCFVRQQQL